MIRYAGVSTMLRAADMSVLDRPNQAAMVRDAVAQMEPALRVYIGDVGPKGEPMLNVDGPVLDPSKSSLALEGAPEYVYVLTYAVPVELDELPAHCGAYRDLRAPQN